MTLARSRGMPGIRVGPDRGTALTRIRAAGIVGSESVRAGQFATHPTVVPSLSQALRKWFAVKSLRCLAGRPSGVRVWTRTAGRTRCACIASTIGTRILV